MKSVFVFIVSFFFVAFHTAMASPAEGDTVKIISPSQHHEVPGDKYVPVSTEDMPRSPGYRDDGSDYFTIQVNTDEDGNNIEGDAANEPSIAIDPTNADRMVIGWRQFDDVNNNFRQAGYAYTLDGGETWTFPGVINPGIFRSDPVLASDNNGNIFYNSLTVSGNNFYCDVFIMGPGTTEWDDGTYAEGGDKQWMTVDQTDGMGEGNIYAFWTSSYSICYPDFFTRSTDGGDSYESCVNILGTPFWGTLATGPDGTLYAGGYSYDGFIVSKSGTAQNPGWPVSWDSYSVVDLNGWIASGEGPNPGGLLGQTWVAVDNSDGDYSGYVYLLCSVQRSDNNDPLDVMFARSTDGGITWDEPVRVNQDLSEHNWQWFGTMSVAPDGRIDVIWLDTRDNPGTYLSSLYYSYSIDGGESFSENEKISESFDPHLGWPDQNKMGDYFHMISDVDYAHLAWANTLNGEQDVYYTRVNPWFVGIEENSGKNGILLHVYPNPAKDEIKINYRIGKRGNVEIRLFNIVGKEVYSKLLKSAETGQNQISVNTSFLPEGIYFLQVSSGSRNSVRKVVLAR
ncbi:MAG: T9SS type A sorting domain-containing protein [Chlorobi bacterium]|nr:T9SS type A sorting domain-containing protein [Chlorobiota bacterium]